MLSICLTFISESDLAEDGRATTERHYAGNGPHVISEAGFEMKPPLEVRDIIRMVLLINVGLENPLVFMNQNTLQF